MSYPALPQALASDEVRPSGRQLDRATNGAPRVRNLNDRERRAFTIVHPGISNAEKESVEAFYVANANNSFSFVWNGDGVSYTVIFGAELPAYKSMAGGWWDVTVQMVEL